MAWIESHQHMARHPKTLRLAGRLKVTKAQAIGHLHLLWWWTLEYAPSGDLADFTAEEIAMAAEWPGEAAEFLSHLRDTGWLDAGMHVHDWQDYAGRLLEERRKNKDRMRRHREVGRLEGPTPADEEWREPLQRHRGFCAAWREWRQHLSGNGRPMSGQQEAAVLRECAGHGPERAAEVIRFSIKKGARNLIWNDAPRQRRRTRSSEPEIEPALWQKFLTAEYPAADQTAAPPTVPATVRADYRKWLARGGAQ